MYFSQEGMNIVLTAAELDAKKDTDPAATEVTRLMNLLPGSQGAQDFEAELIDEFGDDEMLTDAVFNAVEYLCSDRDGEFTVPQMKKFMTEARSSVDKKVADTEKSGGEAIDEEELKENFFDKNETWLYL